MPFEMKDPCKDYGHFWGRIIRTELNHAIHSVGAYNIDNFRWAFTNKPEEIIKYEEAQANGCCGYYDATQRFLFWTFYIGFNYGH